MVCRGVCSSCMLFLWLIYNLRTVGHVKCCVCHGVCSIACCLCDCFTIFTMWGMLHAVYAMVSARTACGSCASFTIFAMWRVLGLFPDLFADDSVDADDNYLLHPDVSRLPYPLRLLSCVLCMPWCQLELHVVCVVDSQSSHSGTSRMLCMPWCLLELHVVCVIVSQSSQCGECCTLCMPWCLLKLHLVRVLHSQYSQCGGC